MTKRERQPTKEAGVIRKRWRGRRSVALVFPDSYGLGMSNLGFQRVYELLNRHEDIVAERFFFHGNSSDVRSLESNRHVCEFDIILFSISFEPSYLNIGPFLLAAGLSPLREERSQGPLVLAGGIACQINPCPAAGFMDAFLLGDFEAVSDSFIDFLLEVDPLSGKREGRLLRLREMVEGVFLPAFPDIAPVAPAIQRSLLETVPHTVIVSNRSSFPNTFLLEVTRGCGRGCRFCAAGFVYRPPRQWPKEVIQRTISDTRGAKKIGLVGLEYADRGFISTLCQELIERGFQLGFSSLRADAITEEFVNLLVRSKNYTATIAPEAGSERLRRIINKNLTQEQILEAARTFFRSGLKNLKLYFMMGLPFEEDGDVEQIVHLALKVKEEMLLFAKGRGKIGNITVSVSTFVPKAWTPFQWAAFAGPDDLSRRRTILKERLASEPNIRLRLDSVENAMLQAVLSRGDEKIGRLLFELTQKGYGKRRMVKKISNIAENYLKRRVEGEKFPWEVVRHRVRREYLLAQWNRAKRAETTGFCNLETCRRCGACSKTER